MPALSIFTGHPCSSKTTAYHRLKRKTNLDPFYSVDSITDDLLYKDKLDLIIPMDYLGIPMKDPEFKEAIAKSTIISEHDKLHLSKNVRLYSSKKELIVRTDRNIPGLYKEIYRFLVDKMITYEYSLAIEDTFVDDPDLSILNRAKMLGYVIHGTYMGTNDMDTIEQRYKVRNDRKRKTYDREVIEKEYNHAFTISRRIYNYCNYIVIWDFSGEDTRWVINRKQDNLVYGVDYSKDNLPEWVKKSFDF